MKKELNSALIQCVDYVLPDCMMNYKRKFVKRAKIVFVNSDHSESRLWLFVIVSPDSKTDSINVHLGWSSDGSVPENLVFDARSLDIRGEEIHLESHCVEMPRLYSNTIKRYEVLPIPNTMEDLAEYSKIIESDRAIKLVKAALVKIQSDLNEYAAPYFNWVIDSASSTS